MLNSQKVSMTAKKIPLIQLLNTLICSYLMLKVISSIIAPVLLNAQHLNLVRRTHDKHLSTIKTQVSRMLWLNPLHS